MSSLQDPFDLIKTGQEMDNIVPFLAPNKVNQMIDAALACPQFQKQKVNRSTILRFGGFGGAAIAACLALFMVVLAPAEVPTISGNVPSLSQASLSSEDVAEFGELVMLDTWEHE